MSRPINHNKEILPTTHFKTQDKIEDNEYRTFWMMYKKFCAEKKMTKVDLSLRTGISPMKLNKYSSEKLQRIPSRETILVIAMGLGLDEKEREQLLRSADYNDLDITRKKDNIIMKYYKNIVEEYSKQENIDSFEKNEHVIKLNEELKKEKYDLLFVEEKYDA